MNACPRHGDGLSRSGCPPGPGRRPGSPAWPHVTAARARKVFGPGPGSHVRTRGQGTGTERPWLWQTFTSLRPGLRATRAVQASSLTRPGQSRQAHQGPTFLWAGHRKVVNLHRVFLFCFFLALLCVCLLVQGSHRVTVRIQAGRSCQGPSRIPSRWRPRAEA